MPELKAIQTKYKDDKQRQQQEVMKFYKENKVNPLGSCLPLAAQLPVFISLFYMLREDLRINICPQTAARLPAVATHVSAAHTIPCGPNNGANFLFISDITNKATGYRAVVLIVLYVGTQLASSLMMSSPTMDKTQRQIMTFMPLLFVIFIINFPAGLLVYWITTNAWTMGQQYFIKTGDRAARRRRPTSRRPRSGRRRRSAAAAAAVVPTATRDPTDRGASAGCFAAARAKSQAEEEPETGRARVPAAAAWPPPPRPPRKKKKRSGRRR